MGIDSKLATPGQRHRNQQRSNVRDVVGFTPPCIYRVGTAFEVQIATTVTGPLVKYKWNKALFVVGMQLMTRTTNDGGATWTHGSAADLECLDLAWGNEQHEQIITSGSTPSTFPGGMTNSFGQHGFQSAWLQIEMQVRAHEIWTFQVTNNSAKTMIPILAFECIEDHT